MQDALRDFFKGHGLTDEQIQKYTIEILSIVALNIIGSGESTLSSEKKDMVKDSLAKNDIASALEVIHSEHSSEDWEIIINKEMEPILNTYLKEVLSSE